MKRRDKSSIVTVDIYSNKSYKLDGGKFTIVKSLKSSKKDIVVSYVANRDLIIEPVELSKNLPKEHISEIITDKVYEELRLDPAVEYQISPVKTALKANNDKYQVLITDKNSLKQTLQPIAKKIKHIDLVVPAPLLYEVLYQTGKLNKDSTDMFIYFGEYDTFITFYNKGVYLYSKSIKFSVQQMYDRFCQLAQDVPLSKEQFRELLANDGLKNAEDKYRELLISIINECFLNINDVLIYTKRAYELQDIKTAYLGFSWGYITGIDSYVSNYLNLDGKSISSIYTKEDPKIAIDPMHALMAMSALSYSSGILELPNLTPYPKPAPITNRPAGKIIFLFIVTFLLFLVPIVYDYFVGASIQANNIILAKEDKKLTAVVNEYKNKLTKKRAELKALEKAISKVNSLYKQKKGELTNVYDKKFKYKLRSEQLALITNIIREHDVKSRFIEISDTLYKIEVESKDEKEITAFIKDLVGKFDKTILNVNIEDIVYQPSEEIYKGVLKLEFIKDSK